MAQRSDFGARSNDELIRLLYSNSASGRAPKPSPPPTPPPAPAPEPLASRRVSELEPHVWPHQERKSELAPVSDREERALFAALSKGTKANLGREPTVPELMLLVERVNDARVFVRAAEQAIQGHEGVYVKEGRIVFSRPPQRHDNAGRGTEAA